MNTRWKRGLAVGVTGAVVAAAALFAVLAVNGARAHVPAAHVAVLAAVTTPTPLPVVTPTPAVTPTPKPTVKATPKPAVKPKTTPAPRVYVAPKTSTAPKTTTQAVTPRQTTPSTAPIIRYPLNWTGAKHPSGSVVPMVKEDDPNDGQYGQMVPEYNNTYCVGNGGFDFHNGVTTCH